MSEVYQQRLDKLNKHQRAAVDSIDGPLLVLAGPGTGKTELLSMRTASILEKTDTLPSSILCLTFTESGAVAMRERLRSIIGQDAYKVAIHTFHGFGTEIINQNGEYFYHGATFRPADELAQYEIMRGIFSELDYTNPLAGMNGEEYTYLSDTLTVISELKRSGLTSEELRNILTANDSVIDEIEADIITVFDERVSKKTIEKLAPVAEKVAAIDQPQLPGALTPYANVLALSIAHAFDEALETDSTKPVTAWKNTWLEKDERKQLVFKDRKRHDKLRAVAHIYYQYMTRMEAAGLYDYDDMILSVIHALETHPELCANLQERYLYIMVDEFQDTNLAQLRLLYNIAGDNPEKANVMAVGDDDQAIYSFQGADSSNVQNFRKHFGDPKVIVLTDNYRSNQPILEASRQLITLGSDRLEATIEGLSKQLTAHRQDSSTDVSVHEYSSTIAERAAVARAVKQTIDDGAEPSEVAIFARRHHELVALLPYLQEQGVMVNYERRDDAISHEVVRLIEHLLLIISSLHSSQHDVVDELLPEVLSHPSFGYAPGDIYRLSLAAWRGHKKWFELMQHDPVFKPLADWLLLRSAAINIETLEQQIDELIGAVDPEDAFRSPLYEYFFSSQKLTEQPDAYLDTLEALRTVRDGVRGHFLDSEPTVQSFLDFLALHRELGTTLTTVRHRASAANNHVQLMTVHKSKGLEFDHVFVTGAIDSMWGEQVRSRSRLISYPANLSLAPAGDSYDERLRLFYVAMTRARQTLQISYSTSSAEGKPTLAASFIGELGLNPVVHGEETSLTDLVQATEIDWRGRLASQTAPELPDLLSSMLENYKLSSTHLGNFIDLLNAGPQHFLLNNLLRFPQAKSASAQYGTAIHATLQRAHDNYRATGSKRPLEDLLGDFERLLHEQHLTEQDFEQYLARGIDSLSAFLSEKYSTFTESQRTELSFGGQSVVIGEARLTGSADLIDIDETAKTIRITDYKTGKAARDWRGRSEYEKVKLHKYRYQLMFYQLLAENSRDYSKYQFEAGILQFVEPTPGGDILALEECFSDEELEHARQLIAAVWQSIMALDMPDISSYEPTLKGIQQFEQDIIDRHSQN